MGQMLWLNQVWIHKIFLVYLENVFEAIAELTSLVLSFICVTYLTKCPLFVQVSLLISSRTFAYD